MVTTETQQIAALELSPTCEVLFYFEVRNGTKAHASIRKFAKSEKYTGPTRSGIRFRPELLPQLIEAFETFQRHKETIEDQELVRVAKSTTRDIVVHASIYKGSLGVDVREWNHDEDYTGWTKKGIRFRAEDIGNVLPALRAMFHAWAEPHAEPKQVAPPPSTDQELTPGIPPSLLSLFAMENEDGHEDH